MAQDPQGDNQFCPILGMGNPLLDISSSVSDEFMQKYKIQPGNAILAEPSHLPMYDELSDMESVEYIGGGSTLNSMRVCQWMSGQDASVCSYIGCIGSDSADTSEKVKSSGKKTHSALLKECVQGDRVVADFFEHPTVPTGTCAVCITDKERSLVANLSAANEFKLDSELTDENKNQLAQKLGQEANEKYVGYRKEYFERLHKRMENAKIIYTAGFFSTVSPETMQQAGKIQAAKKENNFFAVNFSAPFIVQFFKDAFNPVLDLASHCFTNDDELRHFAKSNGMVADDVKLEEIDVKDIASKISLREYSKQDNDERRQLTVICTQGKDPTLVAVGGQVTEYAVPVLEADKIVDLNGAGDAFVGGFLSQALNGKDVETCVKAGNAAARCIIQSSGTNPKALGKPPAV